MKLSVEAGKRAAADSPDPSAPFSPGSTQPAALTFPASPPAVAGAAPADDKLNRFYEPCPQGEDCAGDGKHRRLFDCEQGCGFRGCAACMVVHDSEPHAGDSETMLEMFRNGGV